jgi:hypothetical protein
MYACGLQRQAIRGCRNPAQPGILEIRLQHCLIPASFSIALAHFFREQARFII